MTVQRIVDADAHPPFEAMEIPNVGLMTQELFFGRMRRLRADAVCGTLTPPAAWLEAPPEDAPERLNAEALRLAERYPEYIPAVWVHPACPESSLRQMEQCAARGVKLAGEFCPEWLENPFREPAMRILALAAELGMAVSLRSKRPEEAEAVADAAPGVTLLAGVGIAGVRDGAALLGRRPGMYLKLSGTELLLNYLLHEKIGALPADRLIFGTGYPGGNPGAKLGSLRWELRDASADTVRAVLGGNAARLLMEGSL